jgi:hypothetical protein
MGEQRDLVYERERVCVCVWWGDDSHARDLLAPQARRDKSSTETQAHGAHGVHAWAPPHLPEPAHGHVHQAALFLRVRVQELHQQLSAQRATVARQHKATRRAHGLLGNP